MTTLTIRNIDDGLKQRLLVRAARHGRSMEEKARDILCISLSSKDSRRTSLVQSIRARIESLGGVDLEQPPREPIRLAPELDS